MMAYSPGRIPFLALTVFWITVFLATVSCTRLLEPESPVQTYVLDAAIDPPSISPSGDKVLLVDTPRAAPGFDTPYIAYTKNPLALDYYTKSEWADTPARMLLPMVVQTLENSNAFQAVMVQPTIVTGDYRLDLDLIRLQQEFLQPTSQVRLILRAKVIDMDTNEVLGSERFEAVVTAPSEDAYGGVQAANRAVAQVLQRLTDFVLALTVASTPGQKR